MKKTNVFITMIAFGCSVSSMAASSQSMREVAGALDAIKREMAAGILSTNALAPIETSISIESLVAAGAVAESYEVKKDLRGDCMVTFKFSGDSQMLKSYRIERKGDSWFGALCP